MRLLSAVSLLSLASFLAVSAGAQQPAHGVRKAATPQVRLPAVTLPAEAGEYAVLYTSVGNIVCRLFPEDAPKAVANFVGLARGTKPWTNPANGQVIYRPLYSNTIFHRVIPGFMIQGGDPVGTGEGSPGYSFSDEISPNRHFDKPGILAMANSGPNTNGSQFFITVAPAEHLEGHYTILGEVVSGQEVADAIANAPRKPSEGDPGSTAGDGLSDKPVTPVKLIRITIRKVAGSMAKPAAGRPK